MHAKGRLHEGVCRLDFEVVDCSVQCYGDAQLVTLTSMLMLKPELHADARSRQLYSCTPSVMS